jgi:hypothetical protein
MKMEICELQGILNGPNTALENICARGLFYTALSFTSIKSSRTKITRRFGKN